MSRKRQKVSINVTEENSPEFSQSPQEPLPGCSRGLDFAGLSYQINGDSVDVSGSLLSEEFELLIPGGEFFLMEKRRTLYKRLADLYGSLKLEDAEEKKKKTTTKLPTTN